MEDDVAPTRGVGNDSSGMGLAGQKTMTRERDLLRREENFEDLK
jgi:hypothetical protein